MPNKVRWGILSTAKIGTVQVIPATQQATNCEVVAICSRSQSQAEAAARSLSIPRSYASYEALLADPEIDAIYNPLPNHLHVEWTIKALESGKHVLCEKPIGLDVAEARFLVEQSKRFPQLKVMEAFMYRQHPQWEYALDVVQSGRIGSVCTINTLFSYFNRNPDDIRNKPAYGGGALMDIGCYPISLSRFIFGGMPRRVLGQIDWDPDFGTDRLSSAIMDFGSGSATFTCSTQMAPYQRVNIVGTEGRYEIEIPFNAPIDRPCVAWLQTAQKTERIEFPLVNQYTRQAERFSQAILDDQPVPTPLTDAVENMQVIAAIVNSARENRWIDSF